ncbi:NYN domain-containing protein [Paraburkholderia sp. HD33-4]|uniref:NYN domain-containing protein n=1 Tax=Paraburkholderia sp. HD33-4 TaxID=2883242 RepID=UPI001F29B6A6|nr:NYN domain-containing protein [Paraburkholderia sp. HD33-4]
MNTVWIVDGTYLSSVLQGHDSLEFITRMQRALTAEGGPIKRAIYFDVSTDVDRDLSGPFFAGLRSGTLGFPCDVRFIPLDTTDDHARQTAQRLLAVETAVELVQIASEDDFDRLVLTAADAALESAVSVFRVKHSKEVWLSISRTARTPVLESFADHVVWLEH